LGEDVKLAKKMLQGFEDAIVTMREHRETIIKTIEQIDEGLI
jgi:hypothetical protein